MTKFFKKLSKPYFCPNFGKSEFSWKKGICQVLNIPTIYNRAKNQKKLMTYYWEKCWTDKRTNRWTERRSDNSDFVRSFIGWGSKKKEAKIQMKMLNGSLLFEEHSTKWTKSTKKCPKQRETYEFLSLMNTIVM